MAGDIEAGRAFVKLLADDQELREKFAQVERDLKSKAVQVAKIGAGIGAVGMAITAPLTLAAKHFADVGSELQKISERTGASVESISALKYAADQSGTSIGTVEAAMRRMQVTVTDASRGVELATASLGRLGIKLEEIASLPPDEQFRLIASKLREIPDPAERAAAAVEIFGKSGAALIPLANDVEALVVAAKEAGVVMSTEAAEGATRLGDALDKAQAVTSTITTTLGAALAPALERVASRYADGASVVNEWIEGHQGLVVAVSGLGYALTALGPLVTVAGGAIRSYAAAQTIATGAGIALNAVLLTTLTYVGAFLAVFLAIGAVLYFFTSRLDFLKTKSGETSAAVKKSNAESQQQSAAMVNLERRKNEELARLYREDSDKRIAASRERDQKVLAQIAENNRATLDLQSQYNRERERQSRDSLDKFLDENARKLKEAEELQKSLADDYLKKVNPARFEAVKEQDKIKAENAELQRKWNLLKNIGQLRENAKLADVRALADEGVRNLEAGRAPTRDQQSAITRLSSDGGYNLRLQLLELKNHSKSLSEIATLLRDGGTLGGDE